MQAEECHLRQYFVLLCISLFLFTPHLKIDAALWWQHIFCIYIKNDQERRWAEDLWKAIFDYFPRRVAEKLLLTQILSISSLSLSYKSYPPDRHREKFDTHFAILFAIATDSIESAGPSAYFALQV